MPVAQQRLPRHSSSQKVKYMSRLHRLIVLSFSLGITAFASAAGTTTEFVAGLDARISHEHEIGRFDGVIVVGSGDNIVYAKASGFANREKKIAHDVAEIWRWASVSKQVAAVLTMQQIEHNALSLDTAVSTVLPKFDGPNASTITVRDLLRHTSGLPNPDDSAPVDKSLGAMPSFYAAPIDPLEGAVPAAISYCAGVPKGARGIFSYNNCDTLILQAILENITRKSFAHLVVEQISEPLRLRSLSLAGANFVSADAPLGYLEDGKREPEFNLATFGAAGAMTGTAADLWLFDRALMNRQLLNESSLAALWKGDPSLGYVALGAWSFPAKLNGCDGAVRLIERRGEIGGIQVRNLIAPSRHAALIVFSNTATTEFGEIWQGKGFSYDLASAAFCTAQ